MRYIQLAGIRCSALGFGCANLMGRVSRRHSLRALSTAFDQGITIFDTARSYGWGESETVVGQFARERRDKVVIATKFGIVPPPRNRLRQALKPVARGLLNLAARLRLSAVTRAVRGQIQHRVSSTVQHGRFDVPSARDSLDTSLRALGTEFVDILYLHGPQFDQVADGEVIRFLEVAMRSGKVRAIGVSADVSEANRIVEAFPAVGVVQIGNNLVDHSIEALGQPRPIGIVTNTPFGGRLLVGRLASIVAAAPDKAAAWAEQSGVGMRAPGGVGDLLLAFALAANSAGVVVCGMHNAGHIVRNARLAAVPPPSGGAFWHAIEEICQAVAAAPIGEAKNS
jgi:aryl-alcohol dehydrogenase-like predicted oxidoreductase